MWSVVLNPDTILSYQKLLNCLELKLPETSSYAGQQSSKFFFQIFYNIIYKMVSVVYQIPKLKFNVIISVNRKISIGFDQN